MKNQGTDVNEPDGSRLYNDLFFLLPWSTHWFSHKPSWFTSYVCPTSPSHMGHCQAIQINPNYLWPDCCVSNHAASFHQPQIYLCTAARSIYQIPVLSIFFFYQHGSKITRETKREGRVADEGWWSFRGKLLRTVKPMNRRDKWSNLKGPLKWWSFCVCLFSCTYSLRLHGL